MSVDDIKAAVKVCVMDDELCKLFVERCMNFEREVSAERHMNFEATRGGYELIPGTCLRRKIEDVEFIINDSDG